ncbi:MAG: porin family protein [Gammaproteobacteria bacterium]|jgi:hypothetical protein
MYVRGFIVGVCLVSISLTAGASEIYQSPKSGFSFALGQVNVDSTIATQERVEDTATYLRFAWEGQTNAMLYAVGISGFLYSDNDQFSQRVVDNFGNRSTAESDASAFSLYGETGMSYRIGTSASADLLGGYEFVIDSSRSIPNCSGCASEDIDIAAGAFVAPRLSFQTSDRFKLSFSYFQYLTGDINNAFSLNIGYSY